MKLYFDENLKLTQRDYEEHVEGTENFDKLTVYYPNTLNYDTITVRYYAKTPDGDEIGPFPLTHNANITGYVGRYLEFNDKVLSQTGVVLITIEFAIKRTSTSLMSYKTAASVKMNVLEAHKVSNDITIYDNEENTIYSMKSAIEDIEGGLDNLDKYTSASIKRITKTVPEDEDYHDWVFSEMAEAMDNESSDNEEAKIILFSFYDIDGDSYNYYAFKEDYDNDWVVTNTISIWTYTGMFDEKVNRSDLSALHDMLNNLGITHNLNKINHINASGTVTANKFNGNLEGNVTGNVNGNVENTGHIYTPNIKVNQTGNAEISLSNNSVSITKYGSDGGRFTVDSNNISLANSGGTISMSPSGISLTGSNVSLGANDLTIDNAKVTQMNQTDTGAVNRGYVREQITDAMKEHIVDQWFTEDDVLGVYTLNLKLNDGTIRTARFTLPTNKYLSKVEIFDGVKGKFLKFTFVTGDITTIDLSDLTDVYGVYNDGHNVVLSLNGNKFSADLKPEVETKLDEAFANEETRIQNELDRRAYFDEVKSLLADNYRAGGYKLIEEEGKLILDIKSI